MTETTDEPIPEPIPDPAFDSTPDSVPEMVDEMVDELVDEIAGESPPGATDAVAGAEPKAATARHIVWGPRTRIGVASLALVAMMFLFVFPTRSYLAQKRQVGRAAHAVEVLKAQNEVLARQARRLRTKSEIERLAREQFNMVMPGEQVYNVVETPASPADTTTTTVP
jgi:cell division protein FtsB